MLTRSHITLAALLGVFLVGTSACRRPSAKADVSVGHYEFHLDDQFVFRPARIECEPGQSLRLRLVNSIPRQGPDLAHNFLLLLPGSDLSAFALAGAEARADQDYIPPSFLKNVLAHSALVHPGQTIEFAFIAPHEPGEYPYVCAFPGHCLLGMQGVLVVRPSPRT